MDELPPFRKLQFPVWTQTQRVIVPPLGGKLHVTNTLDTKRFSNGSVVWFVRDSSHRVLMSCIAPDVDGMKEFLLTVCHAHYPGVFDV